MQTPPCPSELCPINPAPHRAFCRRRNASSAIDALAIGPYFGQFSASRDTSLGTFLDATLPGQINGTLSLVAQHAAIARQFGKPLLTYEAGQGLIGDNPLPQQVGRRA
jgi:hypothetical protein